MSAIRLARGFTGRDRDREVRRLLPRPRRQPARHGRLRRRPTLGVPDSPGVPAGRHQRHARRPATTTRGAAPPSSPTTATRSPPSSSSRSPATWASCRRTAGFLHDAARPDTKPGALLIFDEVMTGFRARATAAPSARTASTPDLTCLGKIVGGGLPVGRLRRPSRHHGTDRARRPGLPGRHALRQPPGDGRRLASLESGAPGRTTLEAISAARSRPSPRRSDAGRAGHDQPRRLDVDRVLQRSRTVDTPATKASTRSGSGGSSARCWSGASTCRPGSSRRRSSRSPTAARRST